MSPQSSWTDMDFLWLFSVCQCALFVAVIVASVKLLISVRTSGTSGSGTLGETQGVELHPGSVAYCLRLCLGWMGALGGAVDVPVTVLANLRKPRCLYICVTVVCLPLLVRQFTMCLVMLLTLDTHLHHHYAARYSSVLTRQRALCLVLLCWVSSVLSSFAQFIGSDIRDTWLGGGGGGAGGPGSVGLELDNLTTTTSPHPSTSPPPRYHHDRRVIGRFLPYGGFLSKFYMEDLRNFTYAEIHSSHWGVCAPDAILSPEYLFYVHGTAVFMVPLVCVLAVYLDTLCTKPRKAAFSHDFPLKQDPRLIRSLALSLWLLALLCLPLHIVYGFLLFSPATALPAWVHAAASFLFQFYSLVPQILFSPPKKPAEDSFPLSFLNPPPLVTQSHRKRLPLAETATPSWDSLKTKVWPNV